MNSHGLKWLKIRIRNLDVKFEASFLTALKKLVHTGQDFDQVRDLESLELGQNIVERTRPKNESGQNRNPRNFQVEK